MKRALRRAILSLAGLCACAPERDEPPNVILICLDTVRADHLGAYGYEKRASTPFMDALASRSLVFTDASATAGWTKPSVPSFLTGTHPAQHGVYEGSARLRQGAVSDVLPQDALTLAEVFGSRGFRTAAFFRNAQLRRGNGFEQGFDLYQGEAGDAREIRWRALDWLDQEGGDERPFFLYLHFLDAHMPYPVPDSYATMFATAERVDRFRLGDWRGLRDAINDGDVPFEEADREALEAIYDGALRYIDDQLAMLSEGLELRGISENTIVCILADHGEEFGEHGRIGHGHGLWENLLQVPWILYVPGRDSARIDTPVSLIDVFPTLLSAARIARPGTSEGVDRLKDPHAALPVFAEHKAPDRYLQSLRLAERKLTRDFTPQARDPQASLPVSVGQRWEAEVEHRSESILFATQLKPRGEDPRDPPEVKGIITALHADALRIGGIEVRYGASTEISVADGAEFENLELGRLVKARGPVKNGALHAQRIKVYPPQDCPPLELRGPVDALEEDQGRGRLRISGQWIAFGPETELKNATREAKPRMTREEVLMSLELGNAVPRQQVLIGYRRFELDQDPGELRALDIDESARGMVRILDDLSRSLSQERLYGDGNTRVLDEQALEELKAIGY